MKKTFNPIALIIIISAFFLGGCRDTEEYQRLSRAGILYVESLDILLESAGDIKIDTTSEQLLQDNRIGNGSESHYEECTKADLERLKILEDLPRHNRLLARYEERTKADLERLKILEDLRRHNRLLARYFILLDELASSDTPERAQGEIEGIIGNINQIGNKIRQSNFIENRESNIVGTVTNLIIRSQIEGALREELEARAETINKELETQEVLLDVLGDSVNNELKIIAESIQTRLVIRPYVRKEPIVREDDWISNRRRAITAKRTAWELADASDAARNFRKVFLEAIDEDFNQVRFNYYLSEIEAFLSFVENINNENK